jgi:5-methylcytosine-specific restriction endonuclease McrA
VRALFLAGWTEADGACAMCRRRIRAGERVEVDHIVEVRVDPSRRLDPLNLRALCGRCHRQRTGRSVAARNRGFEGAVGADGMPLDPRHPWNSDE